MLFNLILNNWFSFKWYSSEVLLEFKSVTRGSSESAVISTEPRKVHNRSWKLVSHRLFFFKTLSLSSSCSPACYYSLIFLFCRRFCFCHFDETSLPHPSESLGSSTSFSFDANLKSCRLFAGNNYLIVINAHRCKYHRLSLVSSVKT